MNTGMPATIISIKPALLPGFAVVDLIDKVPEERLVLIFGVKEVPTNVKEPDILAFESQIISFKVRMPIPEPEIDGLFEELIMHEFIDMFALDDITKAGEEFVVNLEKLIAPVELFEQVTV
jgi:hypothetical protein